MFCTVEQLKPYLPLLRPDSGEAHLSNALLGQKLGEKAVGIQSRGRLAGYGVLPAPPTVVKRLVIPTNPAEGETLDCGNLRFSFADTAGQLRIEIGLDEEETAANVAAKLSETPAKTLCTAVADGSDVLVTATEPATDFLFRTSSDDLTITSETALSQRNLILRTLNLEEVASEELAVIGAHWDPELQKAAAVYRQQAAWIQSLFDAGLFDYGFSQVIPTESLCSPEDVRGDVPGFKAEVTGTPTLHQVTELCTGYSSIVYALAALAGYPVTGLTDDQASLYRRIVRLLVAATIHRSLAGLKIEGYAQLSGALNPQANAISVQAFETLCQLQGGYFDEVF